MIRNIITVLLVFAGVLGHAQSTTQNYAKEIIYKEGQNPGGSYTPGANDFITTTYYDGFGRPIQQVQHNMSAMGPNDIATHIEYEKNIGQTREYLPFVSSNNTGAYIGDARHHTEIYYNATSGTPNPYSENRLEASPNARVLETGAPGADWQIDTAVPEADRHTIRYSYAYNSANEVKKFDVRSDWNSSRELYTNSIMEIGFYPANSLKKTVVKNENWKASDGKNNTIEEFKGVDGKVLLKRTYNKGVAHDTYYVYDFYGNLSYVIPPLANGIASGINLNNLCYQYLYDEKNRLVEKKQPQKGWEFIVYDKADRIVMTGPAKNPFDAAAVGWIVTKYDNMGRTLYTGFYNGHPVSSANRKLLKVNVYAQTDNNEGKQAGNDIDGVATYYTNTKFPTKFNLLTVNYYDNYDFPGAPVSFPDVEGVPTMHEPKGLATGSWTRVVTTANEHNAEVSYTLYNHKYQPLRTYTANYLGGYTQTDNALTFRGIPTKTVTTHKRTPATAVLNVTNNYTYDNKERLKTHTQQINGTAAKLIAENVYDDLGKLTNKKVGGTSTVPLQDVLYGYNVRGWLTGVNQIENTVGPSTNKLFNYALNYNQTFEGDISQPQYNGNISSVAWRTLTDNEIKGYGYDYDHLNRLNYAGHLKSTGNYRYRNYTRDGQYAENLTYDKNGNITTLQRYGQEENGQPIEWDDLTYAYNANQLQSVTDATNNSAGFSDGNSVGVDYVYDSFGNMTTDKNKGITAIRYNHLNLPTEITFANGKINYTYTATGTKMKKVVTPTGGTAQTTDYLHGFEYENTELKTFPHPEGYVKKDGTNYIYHYIYRDHLGNNRLVYADLDGNGVINPATEIVEENNYYPFGLKHQGYNNLPGDGYKYKLNGKEYEDSFGLNIYEMDLRQYDPAIGRWVVQDPVIHHDFSPYSAFDNNPVYWADPSGANSVRYNWGSGDYDVLDKDGKWVGSFDPGMFGDYQNNPEEFLQNFFSLEALTDNTGDGSTGSSNIAGNSSQPVPKEYRMAYNLASQYGYTAAEQKIIIEWLKNHPAVVNNGIVTLKGIDVLQIDLNKGLTLEQALDKALPAGSKFAFKKLLSSLASKTAGGVSGMLVRSQSLNNYPNLSDQEMHRAKVQTAESMLIYHIFQRDITTQAPSMLNGMDSSIIINSPSLWDMFYRNK